MCVVKVKKIQKVSLARYLIEKIVRFSTQQNFYVEYLFKLIDT